MDHNIALYNSRIIQVYLEYTSKNYSAVNIDFILENAKITKFEVEDPACWFSQAQVDSFYEGLVENTKNTNIAREAGRYIVFSGVTGGLRQYTLGLLNLTTIFSLMDKLYSLMSRASTITTKKLGPNMVEVIATPKHGVNEKLYQCENRLGSFESLPRLFTSKYAKVEHPLCFHKGDECCRYIISWEIPPSMLRKRIRNYLLALGIPASAILLIVMPIVAWIIFFLVLTCLALCFSFYCEYLQRMELYRIVQNQGDAAEDLFEEIKIRHNNATLVKEIGQATSSILDISELVSAIAQTMDKHLDFDRGLIMLAGEDKSRLVYADGFGYSDDQEEVLRQTEFHLDNPESKGILVRAFKEQRPLLVNDIIENKNDLSKRSLELAKQMNVQSLVCVPIVYEKESIGIIAVDNLMSKRPLTQSDISLLSGVASQTAVSIVNSRAFQRLHQSEQKYRELVENANSIILRLDFNG
ncbi:MAG: GAF domain-containing protein, partial [Thermodesulfobacteriota bacterium]|nr:GAF domain-containing protein [Thermodesulfobacteriota bacterium]